MTIDEIGRKQATYYGRLLSIHGPGIDAVASGRMEYKWLRYEQLCDVVGDEVEFSLHDVGFGLGHLRDYISHRFCDRVVAWSGSEVTREFVDQVLDGEPEALVAYRDLSTAMGTDRHDYMILAGIFYHLAGTEPDEFIGFMEAMLTNCWEMCRKGLAFNVITDSVDYRRDDLFYPDFSSVIGIVRRLTRFFEIDHATPLYEYTIRMYRDSAVAHTYPDPQFDKYLRRASTKAE